MKNLKHVMQSLVTNATLMRSQLLNRLLDSRRDLNAECGYPIYLTTEQCRDLYKRDGIAQRVVTFWPDECWQDPPEVRENEDPDETEFEKAWKDLDKKHRLGHLMHKADRMAGIGRFGVILLGVPGNMAEPAASVNEKGEITGKASEVELLYLRAFAEDAVTIDRRETNLESPRFGKPETYTIKFEDTDENGNVTSEQSMTVHWTRVIHIADLAESSEIYGTRRMEVVLNRLMDLQKVHGGSGEMFWKGAFPGYAIETHPDIPDADVDEDTLKTVLSNYFNGLQRYMSLTGVTVKSLTPQVADPTAHSDVLMKVVAFAMGVPWRKFVGSEQAQLASEQDSRTWNKRVAKRQTDFLTPVIVRALVDRMQKLGILPEVEYEVVWPDLNTVTDLEKAEVGLKRTEALSKYVMGDVQSVIPPEEFMIIILGMDPEEVSQITEAMDKFVEVKLDREEDEMKEREKRGLLNPLAAPDPEAEADNAGPLQGKDPEAQQQE